MQKNKKILGGKEMSSKLKKVVTLMVCLSMATSLLAGCGKKAATSSSSPSESSSAGKAVSYPIKSSSTLDYWVGLNPNVAVTKKNLGETEFAKELEKETGVKINFIHPAVGQGEEKFNLMVASAEMPDLVEYNWLTLYPGGPDKAIKDKNIVKLNDYIDKFAPNLKKYLKDNPEIDKLCKTDDGSYYAFPFLRQDDTQTVFYGPMIRKDWLKDVGMEVPTTVDEWEKVLTAFKEKKGAGAPLSYKFKDTTSFLSGAYNAPTDYFVDNGKVKYGPLEAGYKEYLTTANRWYKAGILDKNFATADGKVVDGNILSGKSGATLGYTGGSMGTYLKAMEEKDPKYDLVAAPFPTKNKGETPKFGQKTFKASGSGVAISTKCKDIETAVRFLDYGYSEKGNLLYNFGIAGTSYNMENNYPKFTELITKNPDKLSIGSVLSGYARSIDAGPFVQRKEYLEQYMGLPQQKEALVVWGKNEADKTNMPLITPTIEESRVIPKIQTDVQTFVDEMTLKFIMGAEPLANFDKFVDQIKKMNVEKAIELKQNEVDRFNKR